MRLWAMLIFAMLLSAQPEEIPTVSAPAFTVIGFSAHTTNEREATSGGKIGSLWQKLSSPGALDGVIGRSDDKIYAVYSGYQSDEHGPYTIVIGVRAPDGTKPPAGMVAQKVSGGPYALFKSEFGPDRDVGIATWQRIWSWPDRKRRAYKTDFEVHTPGALPGKNQMLIYVGVH